MSDQLHAPVSRAWQVLAGALIAPLGLACLAVFAGSVWAYSSRVGDPSNAVIVGTLFLLLGVPATLLGLRLLFARPRRADGGLIGPLGLRFAAVLFVLFPVLSLLRGSWDSLLGLTHLGAAAACLALARARSRRTVVSAPPATHPQ